MSLFMIPTDLRRFTLVSAVVVILVACAPLWAGGAGLRLTGEFITILSLAILWNLLAGYAGLLSIGQQAFVGLGGYALFIATGAGLSPYVAILVAPLAAALLAAIFAPLLFRLEGAYFAIGTWVAAETVLLAFTQIPSLGGGAGMSLPAQVVKSIADQKATREFAIYWVTAGIGAATLLGTFALLRSRAGLALTAIRDNPLAAASLGINIWRTKFLTYVVVAAATGAIGAVISLQKLRISPSSAFSLNDWTVTIVFIVVIGGIGRLEGAVLGTLIYFVLRELLSDFGAGYMIVLGAVAIIVMLFSKKGLWHLLETRFGWTLFPTIRHP